MADPHPQASSGRERRGFEPWPWVLAGMVAGMMTISMSLYFIASANVDGVVGDAWEAGLAFNDDLAARRSAIASGAQMEAHIEPAEGGARIGVEIRGAQPERVVVWRIRPAQSGFDVELPLQLESGVWGARIELPAPGRWRFRVEAELENGQLEQVVDFWHGPKAPLQ